MADAMQVGCRTVDEVGVRCAESTGPSEHLAWEERADDYSSLIADWYRATAACGPTAAVMSPATDGGNDETEQ